MIINWLLGVLLITAAATTNVTIAIIGTNDIHGSAFPTKLFRPDNKQSYNYGGIAYMGRLIQIIQQQNPNRTIYLDAGDQFQGGIESSSLVSSGKIMNDFYSALGVQGSALGNHQFDFGPDFLFPYMSTKRSPYLAANLHSQANAINFMPNQQSSRLFTLDQGIKIGVIGLATLETPSTTAGFSKNLFPAYKFLAYKDIVIQQAKSLRKQGADAVIIVGHVGNDCSYKLDYGIWRKQDLQNTCPPDEITNLIDALPKGTIDGIVQGHRHRIVHHFYKDIPFMGSINGGYYFNVMYLTFGIKKSHLNSLSTTKSIIDVKIEGPIPVCQKIFSSLGRCNYLSSQELKTAGELINWKFHNQDVYAHRKVQTIFNQDWLPKMQQYLQPLVNNQVQLAINSFQQNDVGNLLTNLVHQAIDYADFVILNPGGFRTVWLPGVIQYQHFYNMMPFNNQLWTFKITGRQLLDTLKVIQQGQKGFYQTWGLENTVRLTMDEKGTRKRQFISARLWNGDPIDPEQEYTGATIDFLLTGDGGDDFKDVMNKVYTLRGKTIAGKQRDMLRPYIEKIGTIKQGTLIDPNRPRLIVLTS